jgi:hypothetical protein
MTVFHQFSVLAASRGEGLHSKLRALLERAAASPSSEVSMRHVSPIQAGPSPDSEVASSRNDVTLFLREPIQLSGIRLWCDQTGRAKAICGKSETRPCCSVMRDILPKWGCGKFMRFGAGIVIDTCIMAAPAAKFPALPQSGELVPFDAGHFEAAAFMDGSLQTVRQDAASESDQQGPPLFGMETEPVAGEVAAKWRAVEADIDREHAF